MGDMIDTTLMIVFTITLIPLTGIIVAITPYLMKKNECFAVTVPEIARNDPYLGSLKRRYLTIMLVVTAAFTIPSFYLSLVDNEIAFLAFIIAGPLVLCILSFVLMLYFRQKVRLYKKEQNWVAEQQTVIASISSEETPKAISLKWNLLYIPILVVTVAVGLLGYGHMPEVITIHTGFDGEANGWMDKSPLVILMPLLIQAFLILCFLFAHWSILRSKRPMNPSSPATSALAYGMFARANSTFLLITGLLLCILMIAFPLSCIGVINLMQAAIAIVIATMLIVVGAIAIAVIYGQGGSRVFSRLQDSPTILADNDQFWKLGVFYYNPDDPSLFLLERFGIGWTVNWARPTVWAIIVGGVVITVAFVVAMFLFT